MEAQRQRAEQSRIESMRAAATLEAERRRLAEEKAKTVGFQLERAAEAARQNRIIDVNAKALSSEDKASDVKARIVAAKKLQKEEAERQRIVAELSAAQERARKERIMAEQKAAREKMYEQRIAEENLRVQEAAKEKAEKVKMIAESRENMYRERIAAEKKAREEENGRSRNSAARRPPSARGPENGSQTQNKGQVPDSNSAGKNSGLASGPTSAPCWGFMNGDAPLR